MQCFDASAHSGDIFSSVIDGAQLSEQRRAHHPGIDVADWLRSTVFDARQQHSRRQNQY